MKTSRSSRAFSLVELLVVIAVIGILVATVLVIAGRASENQKRANTLAIMKNIELAIDQFATIDPLKSLYNSKGNASYGPYPAFAVAGNISQDNSIAELLDAKRPKGQNGTLADRLARDLLNDVNLASNADRITLSSSVNQRQHDDNRALYAYLNAFVKDAVTAVPQNARKPLDPEMPEGEFFNPSASTGANAVTRRREILGFHDGWGVPLDYTLYVRLEFGPDPDGGSGGAPRIVERIPVLRSKGVSPDEAKYLEANPNDVDPAKWVWSRPLPGPFAQLDPNNGVFATGKKSDANGWARAVGKTGPNPADKENYGWIPDEDPDPQ